MTASRSIEELERALQRARSDDRETLAVYADALEAAGDPRGELIAIDLELAKVRAAAPIAIDRIDELVDRKREVLRGWLGDTIGGVTWHPRQIESGLLDGMGFAATSTQSIVEYARGVLGSPVGGYLQSLVLYGTKAELEQVIDVIVARPLPWLRRLTLHCVEARANASKRTIDRSRLAALAKATPNLVDLSVIGSRVVATPIHPNVHTLRLIGGDGLVVSDSVPNVTTLDLALRDPEDFSMRNRMPADALAGLINPRTFPALRVLDLARNEGHPEIVTASSPQAGALQIRRRPLQMFLDAVEELGRFERLRLPSIDDTDRGFVLRLLDRHPALTIEVARMWVIDEELAHPRLHVPPPRAWPAPGVLHGRDALTIAIPPERYGEDVALSSMVRDLEQQFDAMPADTKQAWIAFWDFVDGLEWEDDAGNDIRLPFDAATLLRALESLDGNGRCDSAVAMLRNAKLPSGATVMIHRYWGW